jgi:hypothetical protein
MEHKWLAVGTGIIYQGDTSKLKLAIFRVAENSRAFPQLVSTQELQLGDLLFLETYDKSQYCKLQDFHRNEKSEIDYWVFEESGIPLDKQRSMMSLTKMLLSREFKSMQDQDTTLLISIKQKNHNQAGDGRA